MKRLSFALATLVVAVPALAQDVTLTPIPLDAATLDISGTWSYDTVVTGNTGPCPPVPAKKGELSIVAKDGVPVQVDVLSGELCGKPMHLMAGDIEWGNLVVGNAKTVDNEGGRAFNSMVAFFYSDKSASGHVESQYVHPGGMSCSWSYRIELKRP
ncbi:hypothetical protein [Marimonas arenosa]|uniref:Uncharacterized protein n=1 Tax=Marimonas arenosa TaxID=1795305 RepID=A0AAE4B2U2_9RHOB|nr:hypothetical protein [Marimonas arenosa]MDQ2088627.1 hypothetical protein [Marimonas arenosa]